MLKIDNDIPAPAAWVPRDMRITANLRALKPGQSVLLPDRTSTHASRFLMRVKAKRPDCVYVTRTVEGGVRVWCLPREPDAAALLA